MSVRRPVHVLFLRVFCNDALTPTLSESYDNFAWGSFHHISILFAILIGIINPPE